MPLVARRIEAGGEDFFDEEDLTTTTGEEKASTTVIAAGGLDEDISAIRAIIIAAADGIVDVLVLGMVENVVLQSLRSARVESFSLATDD